MKLRNLIGTILVAVALLSAAACSPQQQTTPEASATAAEPTIITVTEGPTETFEPFFTDTPEPDVTEEPAAPAGDETAEPGAGDSTPAAADATSEPAAGAPTATTAPASGQPAGGGQAPAAGTAPDKYQYISQTLPDGYQVRPNVQVTISWTVKNIGTTAWDKNYSMRYFVGPKPKDTYIAFPKAVSANTTTQFSVTFTTPAQPGDYDLWYKLTNAAGQNFGDLDFKFTVTNTPNNNAKPAAAPTPTP